MPKNKMITKACPKCVQQLPVACKACPCGHSFFSARKAVIAAQEVRDEGTTKRRRTERVKREKPNYYDSFGYVSHSCKQKRNRTTIHGEHNRKAEPGDTQHRLKKKRKKKVTEEKEQDDKEVSLSLISPENSLKCFVILAEINRKMGSTSWRA
ncbi:hypothetical protein L9F63_024565 [Diploptera punctata]|uniref:UPF0547 domain-containing protein n=1 Tax=Diploptera punctata TaxID=6984 RepID=A0AAD8E784_DIPPU|nr:hypothetical protein L9F63_024565 [Diploptera punctata]